MLALGAGRSLSREQIVDVSKYLKTKGELVLGVKYPRVDSVDGRTLTLLLPGKRNPRSEVRRLVEPVSIELYHLSRVATARNPDRPWKMKTPSSPKAPYLFLGPRAQRIDSKKDPELLIEEVVGSDTEPVLTGRNILPTAFVQELDQGWAVQVKFDRAGARILREFTRTHKGEYLAVFHNRRLISAPLVEEVIPDGTARMTGFASPGLARRAVSDLNAGTLPVPVRIARVEYY